MVSRPIPQGVVPRRAWLPVWTLKGLLVAAVMLLPHYGNPYLTNLVVIACVYATVNISWNLVLGYGGLFTFGQMGFFAVGGYTAALINLHLHLSPWLTTVCGAAAAAVAGAILGLPSLRLYGPYMVLFTLAFQEIVYTILVTDTSGFFGSGLGLEGLDSYALPGISDTNAPYYTAVAMLVLSATGIGLLVRSPIGIAVQALRDNRASALARGVSLVKHRMIIFVVSAMTTGLAGALYAHYYSIITPASLSIGLLVSLLAMIIVGGVGSTWGVIAGTAAFVYLNDMLATQQQYSAVLWGGIIVAVVLIVPGGIASALRGLERLVLQFLARKLGNEPTFEHRLLGRAALRLADAFLDRRAR